MDAYLGIVPNPETKLFHGALFRNRPTPSGSERYMLDARLREGHLSVRAAARHANESFPDIEPLDVGAMKDIDLSPLESLPRRSRLTVASPCKGGDAEIELRGPDGGAIPTDHMGIDGETVGLLVSLGRLVPDSSSGDDPALEFRYDHFLLA